MKRLVFLLLLLLLIPPHAGAQENPITWTIVPGFNGTSKMSAWTPVTITVSNAGNDIGGRLEWRWGTSGTRFGQTIDLPRGAKKRIVLPVVNEGAFGERATLELIAGDQVIASEKVRSNQVDISRLVIGVVSDTSNALPEVGGLHARVGNGTTLVRLDPAQLPDRGELLQSLDILFVHNVDTSAWSDAQRAALELWVTNGGRLVVSGDRPETAAGIGMILPAAAASPVRDVPLSVLSAKSGWRPREPDATVKALTLTPAVGTTVLAATPDGAPLIARRSHGSGQIIQAAFDLQALSLQGDPVPLWERLLPFTGMLPPWYQLRSNGEWVLRQSLAFPALQLPPLWSVLGFLVLYIGLVGPVNYLLLRRVDRREWAYLSIPLTVLVFTLGAYAIGTSSRGGIAKATGLTIVRAAPGSARAYGVSYVGVFSPVRKTYALRLGPEALVSNTFSMWDQSAPRLRVLRGEAAVEAPSFLIDVGAMRPLTVEQQTSAPEVHATFQRRGNQFTFDIENRSGAPLTDVALVVGQSAQKLTDFKPGERRTVQLKHTEVWSEIPFRTGGVIKRSEALNMLRGSFGGGHMVAQAMPVPPPEGVEAVPTEAAADVAWEQPVQEQNVMLVAWASGIHVGATLDGTPLKIEGETLYLWPISGAAR